nr:methyltransferase domain-containing protein [Clostridium sp.]
MCHCVLEYVKERTDVFKEFCRVLKPNGIISILKPPISASVSKSIFRQS